MPVRRADAVHGGRRAVLLRPRGGAPDHAGEPHAARLTLSTARAASARARCSRQASRRISRAAARTSSDAGGMPESIGIVFARGRIDRAGGADILAAAIASRSATWRSRSGPAAATSSSSSPLWTDASRAGARCSKPETELRQPPHVAVARPRPVRGVLPLPRGRGRRGHPRRRLPGVPSTAADCA